MSRPAPAPRADEPPAPVVRVGLEQLDVVPGKVDDNRRLLCDRARAAFTAGCQIVAMPELAVSGYLVDPAAARAAAEPLDGPSVAAASAVAARHEGIVVFGFCERQGDALFNTVVAVDADGPVLHYRKLHLFDAEKEAYTPGDLGLPVARTAYGNLAVSICYDLRFVEVLRLLALQGADLVVAPAAWVTGFDKPGSSGRPAPAADEPVSTQHVDNVRIQANLNQVAVVAVSQVGGARHGGAATLGGSAAFDAAGTALAGPLSRTDADSAVALVDIAAVRASRIRSERIRPREDRRDDVYGLHYAGRRW